MYQGPMENNTLVIWTIFDLLTMLGWFVNNCLRRLPVLRFLSVAGTSNQQLICLQKTESPRTGRFKVQNFFWPISFVWYTSPRSNVLHWNLLWFHIFARRWEPANAGIHSETGCKCMFHYALHLALSQKISVCVCVCVCVFVCVRLGWRKCP